MSDSSDEDKKKSAPPSRQNSQASIDSSCSSFEKIEPEDAAAHTAAQAAANEAADTQLYAAALPPIVLLGNKIVDTPDPDPRTVPIKPSQEQYYTADTMRSALSNLVLFSVAMFTAPFITMYLSYHYVFLDYFGLSRSDAMLDAGMIGVGTVFFIMAGFCYVAYQEEVDAEKEKKAREEGGGEKEGGKEMKWGELEKDEEEDEGVEEGEEGGEKQQEQSGDGDTASVAAAVESKKDK